MIPGKGCDHEKCYLVSRKELFHPIKGILAAGLQMEVIFKKTFGHPQIHRVDTDDQDVYRNGCFKVHHAAMLDSFISTL